MADLDAHNETAVVERNIAKLAPLFYYVQDALGGCTGKHKKLLFQ